MTNQLRECNKSEAQAQELVSETLTQLQTAKKMVETLRSDGCKATEAYDSIVAELEQSRARVNFLEALVSKLKVDMSNGGCEDTQKKCDCQNELASVKLEVEQLRCALEVAEMRSKEEKARSSEETRSAFEMVERIKSEAGQREAELEAELRKSKYEIEELKANMMDKESELQSVCDENDSLITQLERNTFSVKKLKSHIENMKARLIDKDKDYENLSNENEALKMEIKKISEENRSDQIMSDLEEAVKKVCYMTEEADKSNIKVNRVSEQLEAMQKANADMEAELRRLKVQFDQLRKAAEVAASMLSVGNNGQRVERTGSMESNYCPRTRRVISPYEDDLDEDLLKKKNVNMLMRFGVLLKKPLK